jgi:hypothetical protein
MSDYLSSLVEKNLSLQESLRPLPHARFEPSSLLGVDPVTAEMDPTSQPPPDAPPRVDPAYASLPPDTSPRVDPAYASLPPDSSPAEFRPAPLFPGPALTGPRLEGGPPARPAPPFDLPGVQPYRGRLDPPPAVLPAPEAKTARQITPTPSPEAPGRAQSGSDHETGSLPPRTPSQPADAPHPPREYLLERIVERTLVPAPATTGQLSTATAAQPVSASPQSAAANAPAPDPGPASRELRPLVPPLPDLTVHQAAPPAPTINVTISRVEVRAAPPSAAPRRSSPQPKLMSLDEYLQSRSSGERR